MGKHQVNSRTFTRVFIISPADCSGKRAQYLLRESATSPIAKRLRSKRGVEIGDVFTFISSLYFRSKLAYAVAFASPPRRAPPVVIIVPGRGLARPDLRLTINDVAAIARTPVDLNDPRYVEPLARDTCAVRDVLSAEDRVVLLGSVATDKYVQPLCSVFGDRLYVPAAFVGRGGMSRGGLLLRAIDAGRELEYVRATHAVRHGPRPPRLAPR